MKIVFFDYSDHFKNIYWNNPNIIFFNKNGWWIIEKKYRENISIIYHPKDIILHPNFNIVNVIAQIREFMPVWSRWHGKGDKYELMIRDAAIQVGKISASLYNFGIGIGVFHTAVSHWMDSIVCELACRIAGWKQIFFYCEPFNFRLLPLIQSNSINDRNIKNLKISDYVYKKDINDFINNVKKFNSPKSSDVFESKTGSNFYYTFFFTVTFYFLKKMFSFGKRFLFSWNKFDFDEFQNYRDSYFFQNHKQLIQQYLAIKFYNSKSKLHKHNYSSVRLIIFAQFQPEATSFPEGNKFGNHIDLAIKLRELGYSDEIFYKEHPQIQRYNFKELGLTKVGMYRSKKYYEQLLFLGCKFINNFDDKNSFLPVTISGTIAIERSLLGLHTIVAGTPWFRGLPGVIELSELKTLKKIPKKYIVQNNKIKKKAFQFFESKLNFGTITNAPGISTPRHFNNKNNSLKFRLEINEFLKKVTKIKL